MVCPGWFVPRESIHVNWLDLVFIALIVLSGLLSLYRGFVREVLSLATWIVAAWVGIRFASELAVHLPDAVTDTTLRMGIAFAILFVLVLIAGGILGALANRLVRGTGLTGTDRSLGVIFGLLRGVLLVAVLVFLAWLTPLTEEGWWEQSRLVPEFERLVNWLLDQLPQSLQERLRELPAEA